MSFETFKASQEAQAITRLLASAVMIAQMEELSRRGKPAVAALDAVLADKLALTHTERQYVGRWIREALAPRGWKPLHQRRLSRGRIFSSGAVYARAPSADEATEIPAELLPFEERMARARAIVREFSTNDYSLDDYLRDKRIEAKAEAADDL